MYQSKKVSITTLAGLALLVMGSLSVMGDPENGLTEKITENLMVEGPMALSIQGIHSSPSDLKVTSGDNLAILTWKAPSHNDGSTLEGYIIQRSIDGGIWGNLTMVESNVLKFVDKWIANGMIVKYRIVAVGDSGWSEPSNVASATPIGHPWAPLSVKGEIYGSNVILRWVAPLYDGGSHIESYTVYRKIDGEKDFKRIASVGPGERLWVDENASGKASVRYYIVAENRAGSSGPSVQAEVLDIPIVEVDGGPATTYGWIAIASGALFGTIAVVAGLMFVRARMVKISAMPIPYPATCAEGSAVGSCT